MAYELPNKGETLVFYDDFKKSDWTVMPWEKTGAGTATLALSTAKVDTAGQSMLLTTSLVNSEAQEVHRYVAPRRGWSSYRFGGVFSVMDENIANIAFYIGYRDGTNWRRAKLLHVFSTNVWSWQDSAGTQQGFLTQDTSESTTVHRWHTFEMDASMVDLTYNYVEVDGNYVNLDNAALRNTADATVPFILDFAFETTNTGAASAGLIYFDRFWCYAR